MSQEPECPTTRGVDASRVAVGMNFLATGEHSCHAADGTAIPCGGSGQDGEERRGIPWPEPRFAVQRGAVVDRLTGLIWSRDANPMGFPVQWHEALAAVAGFNREGYAGRRDWRLPNRRELRSLVDHQRRMPALPRDHPFTNLFMSWYWSSTTVAAAPAHAWYLHLEGGRMFYGGKDQSFMVWPVAGGGSAVLPATGQRRCFDRTGRMVPCAGSGQDAESRLGVPWPEPRFEAAGEGRVRDRLTGLVWARHADLAGGTVDWGGALRRVAGMAPGWRLPNINELESLVDCDRAAPALPATHLFDAVQPAYWSATTSLFEPDWAWALYLDRGSVGVGQKKDPHFAVWAVFPE